MNLNNQIYYILKTLNDVEDFKTVNLNELFKLEELSIPENKFYHLVNDLIDENYINGLKISFSSNNQPIICVNSPHLTKRGLEFLEKNSNLNKFYRLLKEVKSWF